MTLLKIDCKTKLTLFRNILQ